MTETFRFDETLMATAAVLFFFVLIRFSAAFRHGTRANRSLAGGGIALAVAPPVIGFAGAPLMNFPADDYQALMYGAALWVSLALAFAAFAISRARTAEGT